MRTKIFFMCCAVSVIVISLAIGRVSAFDAPTNQQPAQTIADAKQLVQQALEAEAQGSPNERAALLQQAQQAAPECADAHWQAGDVKLNGAWTHFDAPSKDPKVVAKLDEYRQRQDQAKNTVQDQTDLALWCEKAGLAEQAKLHWFNVLKLQPNSKQAQSKLGVVRYHGMFMPASQVASFNDNQKKQQADFTKWKDQLAALRKQVESGNKADEALDQIRDIHDVAAIPAMEAEFGKAKLELGKAVVQALSKMQEFAATQSLVKFAVLSPHPEVRQDAAKALKPRSMFAYVPLLVSGLDTLTSVTYGTFELPNGSVGYQMSLYKPDPWGDKMYSSSGLMDTTIFPSAIANATQRVNQNMPAGWVPGSANVSADFAGATSKVAAAAARSQSEANQVQAANDRIAASNELIISALTTSTGQDLGSDPMAWWNWWFDYNEYDRPKDQTTQYTYDYTYSSPYTMTVNAPMRPLRLLHFAAAMVAFWQARPCGR